MTETNLLAPVASGLRALQPTETTEPNAAERPRGAPPPEADVIAPDDIPRDIAREAASSEKMLEKLIGKATARMPSMTQSILEEFKGTLKRPKLFETGYVKWGKIADAAAKVDNASAELARIPAAAFRDVPLDPANFEVLRTYTEAQNKLCAALKTFQASTRSTSAVIQNLITAAEFRTAEALNLVAMMQLAGKAPDAVAAEEAEIARQANARFDERSAGEAMRELSPTMHGAKVLEGLKSNIAGFMAEVGALEANRKGLNPNALQAAAKSLSERAAELKSSVSSEAFQGQGIAPDELLRKSLEDALAAIAIRLDKMTEQTPENIVENALSSMLSKIDADLIEEVLQAFPEQCRPLLENLKSAAIEYNAMTDALTRKVNDAGTSDLSAEAFRDALAATVERLVGKTGTAPGGPGLELLKNLRYLAHQRDDLSGDEAAWLQANIQRQCGIHLSRKEIRALHREVQSAPIGENSPLMTLMEGLEGKIAWVGAKILDAEISEISGMYANLTITKPDISSDYVLNAIDRYVSMPCLIDAALRGLPMNQLELRAGQEVLKAESHLGQGAVNSVTLCTFRDEDGEDLRLVFKPETEAHRGLEKLCAGALGYVASTRVMQINIAAWKAADAIHAGDVIAKSSIGMHENRMGLFMEAAPGKTARKFLSALPELQLSMSTDAFQAFRGNLMRELSKLEWADMLSGQADRHSENYLVDVDPDTGRVKITGIDNDASFGARRVGMTKIDVSDKPELQKRLGLEPPPAGTNAPVIVNAHNYHGRQFAAFREAFGFNQLFRPTHIDRETFDALMNVNTIEYGNQMRQCMDEGAAKAALLRLSDAQNWARELEKHGRVISGDEWQSNARIAELKAELQTVRSGFPPGATRQEQALEAQLRLGFFARDFRMLL